VLRGVAMRTEIELQLAADTPPGLALDALRQAAAQRGALALAQELGDALADGRQPLAQPFLELQTERTLLDLERAERGWQVELALDRVQLLGHRYAELEIEAELKRGDDAALESIRTELDAFAALQAAEGGKLSRALAHLEHCRCARPSRSE
jgi:inorganic triphosphatase YgiF